MANSARKYSYTVGYKINVIEYAKQPGNTVAERRFRLLPTEKNIYYWKEQENLLRFASIRKRNLHQAAAKWQELEQKTQKCVVAKTNSMWHQIEQWT